jgi:hypothetical protein
MLLRPILLNGMKYLTSTPFKYLHTAILLVFYLISVSQKLTQSMPTTHPHF